MSAGWDDPFADVQKIIDGLDETQRRVMLLRLAKDMNNGEEHFDHGDPGYSWLCLKCGSEGKHADGGRVGAIAFLEAVAAKANR